MYNFVCHNTTSDNACRVRNTEDALRLKMNEDRICQSQKGPSVGLDTIWTVIFGVRWPLAYCHSGQC